MIQDGAKKVQRYTALFVRRNGQMGTTDGGNKQCGIVMRVIAFGIGGKYW